MIETEAALLRGHGLEVQLALRDNAEAMSGATGRLGAAWRSSYDAGAGRDLERLCRQWRPDVVHVHNFWFSWTPAVHAAAHRAGAATVQTIHNFRLFCVNALLFREGRICEDCLGRLPLRGIVRRCYHQSVLDSAAVARMIVDNRVRGTWRRDVDALIALTNFAKDKLVAGGLPTGKLVVKGNSIEDPGRAPIEQGRGALYLGRLSREKGLGTLIDAWRRLDDVPLTIIGDGPMRSEVEARVRHEGLRHVEVRGAVEPAACLEALRSHAVLVVPSLWYEGFPRVVVEAYATGRPVIASRLGSLAEVVGDGETGLLFEPAADTELATRVRDLLTDRARLDEIGRAARRRYETLYTPERNLDVLLSIYRDAMRRRDLRGA